MEGKIQPLNQEQAQQIQTIPNIHQRIIGIMSELHYIAKGDKTVNGQYRFVSHDQVVAKVQKMLVKYRVTTVPTVHEVVQDGNRTMLKLNVTFVNADNPSDNFTVQFPGYGIDGGGLNKDGKAIAVGDKGPGKAISYAYKYALLKIFNLETGDDPDFDAEAAYEPVKCLEFDLLVTNTLSEPEKKKLHKFLTESAEAHGKHIEEIKTKAVANIEQFSEAFKKWSAKK